MPKAIDPALKSQAQYLFVMQGLSYKQIAKQLGIHDSTVSRWANENDKEWQTLRALKSSATLSVEMHAVQQMDMIYKKAQTENRILTPAEIDMTSKLRKQIETLNKDLGFVTNGIEVIGQFMEYVRKADYEVFDKLKTIAVEFTQELAKNYRR